MTSLFEKHDLLVSRADVRRVGRLNDHDRRRPQRCQCWRFHIRKRTAAYYYETFVQLLKIVCKRGRVERPRPAANEFNSNAGRFNKCCQR